MSDYPSPSPNTLPKSETEIFGLQKVRTFVFSDFGGTKALGLLVSLTLLVAMITNLVVLPTLLLTLERKITTKSFEEPYFDAYAEESELDWGNLSLEGKGNNEGTDTIEPKSDE